MNTAHGTRTEGRLTRRLAVTGGTVLVAVGVGVAVAARGAAARAVAALLVGSGGIMIGGISIQTARGARIGGRLRSVPTVAQFGGAALLWFTAGVALAFGPPLIGLPAPTYPDPTPLLALATACVGVSGMSLSAALLLGCLRLGR